MSTATIGTFFPRWMFEQAAISWNEFQDGGRELVIFGDRTIEYTEYVPRGPSRFERKMALWREKQQQKGKE